MSNWTEQFKPVFSPSCQPKKPLKLVLMSDLHERDVEFPNGDILILAGDLTFREKGDLNGQLNALFNLNSKLEDTMYEKIFIIPGNHDVIFEKDYATACSMFDLPCVTILNQDLHEYNGIKIYGEPRTPEFYDWAFNVRRSNMKLVWDMIPDNIDILVTHGPPLGIGDLTPRGEHVGCEYQREWILKNKPKMVVCGHIHNGYGVGILGSTMVVNASICTELYKPMNKPIIIEYAN